MLTDDCFSRVYPRAWATRVFPSNRLCSQVPRGHSEDLLEELAAASTAYCLLRVRRSSEADVEHAATLLCR